MIFSSLQNIAANENKLLKQVYDCFKKSYGDFDLNKALEYTNKVATTPSKPIYNDVKSNSEWKRWAKNLYYGLTQINADS